MAWPMVYGLWSMAHGPWSMVYGLWPMVYGPWSMVYGLWSMAYGPWPMVYWFMVYGLWSMAHGLWSMVYGLLVRLSRRRSPEAAGGLQDHVEDGVRLLPPAQGPVAAGQQAQQVPLPEVQHRQPQPLALPPGRAPPRRPNAGDGFALSAECAPVTPP